MDGCLTVLYDGGCPTGGAASVACCTMREPGCPSWGKPGSPFPVPEARFYRTSLVEYRQVVIAPAD